MKVDIYSDHYYPVDASKLTNDLKTMAGSNKVYIIGEYGWTSGDVQGVLRLEAHRSSLLYALCVQAS
jgi:hypothetical protein